MRTGLACVCLAAAPALADELTLAAGAARLTGTVRAIDAAGAVELASELAPEPLQLRGEAVEKVEFSSSELAPMPPNAVVELVNGDVLPATIEGMEGDTLTVSSPDAGRLAIPRDALASVQLGIRQPKVLYTGPQTLDEWTRGGGGPANWTYENHAIIANGPATASQQFTLPRQFILRLTMRWAGNRVPKFEVAFADPLQTKEVASDRYFLRFNGAGLEIKREAAHDQRRYHTVAQLNRVPNQYPDRQLRVEIRVDRNSSRLKLFLNGEPEGEFVDPVNPPPTGSGIALVCDAVNGSPQEIRDVEILEYDESRVRHRAEDRGNPQADSMISSEDDRWGGRLLEIRKGAGGLLFRFKSDFQPEPLEIPEADVSTVFFASQQARPVERNHPFALRLRADGALQVASCRFSGDTVTAAHPLLGELSLRRPGVVALQRREPDHQPQAAPQR